MTVLDYSSYSGLQAAVLAEMERDNTDEVKGWITLAEAVLNRKIDALEDDASLTGTASSRFIDTSALSIVEPISLFITQDDGDERQIQMTDIANLSYSDDVGEPSVWAYNRNDKQIVFDCPLDSAYSFRFYAKQKFALSDSNTTNWLLENHPDVYVSATIVAGAKFVEDAELAGIHSGLLRDAIADVKSEIAQSRRAELRVDPMLGAMGGYNIERDV